MRIALPPRVRAGRTAEYERAHADVPAELTDAGLPVGWQL